MPGQRPSSPPGPCIAQEMLGTAGRVPQGKEPLRDVPSWDKRYLLRLSLGMLRRSRPVAHPRQEGGSRTRTEVTQYTQPCKSGMKCHRGHQPFHPTVPTGASTAPGTSWGHRVHWEDDDPQQLMAGLASSPGTGIWDRTGKTMYRQPLRGCNGGSCTKIALVSTQIRAGPGSGAVSAISLSAAKCR